MIQRLAEMDQHTVLYKIGDGKLYGNYHRKRVPADFIGHYRGRPLLIEAKQTRQEKIPASRLYRNKSRHQLAALKTWAGSNPNCIAGYALLFQKFRLLAFLDIKDFPEEPASISKLTPNIRYCSLEKVNWGWLISGEIR